VTPKIWMNGQHAFVPYFGPELDMGRFHPQVQYESVWVILDDTDG